MESSLRYLLGHCLAERVDVLGDGKLNQIEVFVAVCQEIKQLLSPVCLHLLVSSLFLAHVFLVQVIDSRAQVFPHHVNPVAVFFNIVL